MANPSFTLPDNEKAFEYAAEHNLEVKIPGENELFIDIDSLTDQVAFNRLIGVLESFTDLVSGVECTRSKSGGDRSHIVVTLTKNMGVKERILLQACLASDKMRELLSYIRVLRDDPFPILLFEKPQSFRPQQRVGPLNGLDDIDIPF